MGDGRCDLIVFYLVCLLYDFEKIGPLHTIGHLKHICSPWFALDSSSDL